MAERDPAPAAQQLISLDAPERSGRAGPADRNAERRTVLGGLLLAAAFVAAAFVAAAFSGATTGNWLPLHLAMAGAAGIAIGTMLPHFLVSLAAATPAPAGRRRAGLALLASGIVVASAGMTVGPRVVAAVGGGLYVGGLLVTAWTGFPPARAGLGRRAGIVDAAYALALLNAGISITLAVLMLLGPASSGWPELKPAHAWLNLIGFVSLVIAGTLIHLYPTVVGGRIRVGWALPAVVIGLGIGAPTVALGYALDLAPVAVAGAVGAAGGSFALTAYAVSCWRGRGRWRTELAWHGVAMGHLNAGIAWFLVAAAAMAVGPLTAGADPAGWSLGRVWGPLVAGWALQVLVGSWTHLIPAVGPGDMARHAAQRRWLALGGPVRLVGWNLGTLALTLGAWFSAATLGQFGAVIVGATLLASVVLVAGAVVVRPAMD